MHQLVLSLVLPFGLATDVGRFYVAVGRGFSFLSNNGTIGATGLNMYGQLSQGHTDQLDELSEVVGVDGNGKMSAVAAGAFHSVFLSDSGVVYASGRNHRGQLGDNTFTERHVAVPLNLHDGENDNATVTDVAAGYAHSLFLKSDGTVWATGLNQYGQLGDGTVTSTSTPKKVFYPTLGRAKAKAIAAGYDFSLVLTTSGQVLAAGNNLGGQMGAPVKGRYKEWTPILESVEMIAAGESHSLFLSTSNQVYGTGANFHGQLGDNTSYAKTSPVEMPYTATSVSAGGDSSCVVSGGQGQEKLQCFGSNQDGQLGMGDIPSLKTPTRMSLEDDIESVSIGNTHTWFVAFGNPGFVYVTGSNLFGQLGDNSTSESRSTPHKLKRLEFPLTTRPPTPVPTPAPPTPAPQPTPAPPPTDAPQPTDAPTEAPSTSTVSRGVTGGGSDYLIYFVVAGVVLVGAGLLCIFSKGSGSDDSSAQRNEPLESELTAGQRDVNV